MYTYVHVCYIIIILLHNYNSYIACIYNKYIPLYIILCVILLDILFLFYIYIITYRTHLIFFQIYGSKYNKPRDNQQNGRKKIIIIFLLPLCEFQHPFLVLILFFEYHNFITLSAKPNSHSPNYEINTNHVSSYKLHIRMILHPFTELLINFS